MSSTGDAEVVDLGGGVELEMVYIGPGSFTMGSPPTETGRFNRDLDPETELAARFMGGFDTDRERQHRVTLTKGFWIGRYPVTQDQWERLIGNNPSRIKGAKHPVEGVNWVDSQEFVKKLNALGTDGTFRLPTEAEWEYACRAGTTTALNNGKDLTVARGRCPNLDEVAWYMKNSSQSHHPVGQKKPNAWGLYDMHGNVMEWCQDWYDDEYPSQPVTDPAGPESGTRRALRGGAWDNHARHSRSADRTSSDPARADDLNGLRVVLSRALPGLSVTEGIHEEHNGSTTGSEKQTILRNLTDGQKRMVLDCGWALKAAVQRVSAGETPAVLGTAPHVDVVNRLSLEELRFCSALYDLEREATRVGEAGDHERAIALFKQLVDKAPWHSIALMSIGVLYAFIDNANEALRYLQMAQDEDPANEQIKQNLRLVKNKFGCF